MLAPPSSSPILAMNNTTIAIAIRQESDVIMASISVMRMAEKLGLSAVECTMCATVVSELATNIVRYAGQGEILLHDDEDRLQIEAKDHGPGIADVDLAMQEGHSGGSGLGMGLSGVARMMDSLDIDTAIGMGTSVKVSKIIRSKKQFIASAKENASQASQALNKKTHHTHIKRLDDAALLSPFPGQQVSGDGAFSLDISSYHFMALWDVSGHGEEAHKLSQRVERFLRSRCKKEPHVLLREMHEKFRGSRGLVAVLARLSPSSGWVEYAGIGNISLLHLHPQGMRRLALQEGVIGYQIRTPKSERLQLRKGDTLIMHSDGIHTIREQLQVFKHTTARQLATSIIEDFRAQQDDDASCLVLRFRA